MFEFLEQYCKKNIFIIFRTIFLLFRRIYWKIDNINFLFFLVILITKISYYYTKIFENVSYFVIFIKKCFPAPLRGLSYREHGTWKFNFPVTWKIAANEWTIPFWTIFFRYFYFFCSYNYDDFVISGPNF